MKRFLSGMISLLLAAFLAIMLLPGSGANAYIVKYGTCGADGADIRWELDNKGILTIQGSGKMEDWDISNPPSPWNSCADVKTVVIRKGVTSIGEYAFTRCENLESITIPDTVTSIGNGAFYGCSGLKEITIPDSVTSIDNYAFYQCSGLKEITIPDRVTSIGNYAFCYCSGLKEITIPDRVTSIGEATFGYCKNLKSITIPDSVTSIDNGAFYYCSGLKEITIPDRVTSISENTFYGCTELKEITIPDSVTSIGNDAFYGCSGLKEITIPDSVTSIGNGAFRRCEKLESITIPDSVTSIGNNAFFGCSGLKEITIPDSVTSIGNSAFVNCEKLESITIPDSVTSIGNYAFFYCYGLKEITIPDSVTSIGYCAFKGCTNLNTVYLPDNPELKIGEDIFDICNNLKYVILNPDVTDLNYVPDSVRYFYYDVKYDIDGPGTISGKTRSYINDVIELTVEPEDNYTIDKITFIDSNDKETPIDPKDNGKYLYEMPATGPVTFKAYFKPIPKNVTFCVTDNGNTTVLQEGPCDVAKSPVYEGSVPTKKPTDQYTYTFIGWTDGNSTYDKDEALPEVTDDVTYYAVFEPTTNSYEISFVDENGEELQSDRLKYGETPVFKGTEPSKAEDDTYTYTFAGWTPEITKVTGDATYSPVFTSKEKQADIDPEVKASFEAFVERMYVVVLDRPSEPEGKTYWTDKVINGELTGGDCARNFLNGQEFKDRNLSDEEFVTVLYKAFFDRDAKDDPDGFNFWMESLKVTGRENIIEGFISSPEWIDLCSEYGVKPGTAKAVTGSAADFATRLYTECLGREPDEEGLKFWSQGLIDHKITGSQAAHEFFYSAEFNSLNLGNKELITRMYRTFLGRDPEDEGLTFWMDSMDKGMTKDQLFDSFVNSKEFSEICVSYAIDR